jgi:hypothetical protein
MNPCASQEQLKQFVGDQLDDSEREIVAWENPPNAFMERLRVFDDSP